MQGFTVFSIKLKINAIQGKNLMQAKNKQMCNNVQIFFPQCLQQDSYFSQYYCLKQGRRLKDTTAQFLPSKIYLRVGISPGVITYLARIFS